jgi:hypothetical protein
MNLEEPLSSFFFCFSQAENNEREHMFTCVFIFVFSAFVEVCWSFLFNALFLFEVTYKLKHLYNRFNYSLRSCVRLLSFVLLFSFLLHDYIIIIVSNFTRVEIFSFSFFLSFEYNLPVMIERYFLRL